MKLKLSNNAETLLAGAINETATTVILAPGTGILLPTLVAGEFFPLILVKSVAGNPVREIVYVTARNTDSCTVLRAQEGTAATTFSAGDYAGCHATAGCFATKADIDGADFAGAISALSISATSASLGTTAITGPVTLGDNPIKGAVLQDCAYAFKDAVAVNTLDYRDGDVQRWAPAAGSQVLTITNWPPAPYWGMLLVKIIDGGSRTLTTATPVKWLKSDGTSVTSNSINTNHGATLQTSGTDRVLFWQEEDGAIWGKVVR